MFLKAVALSAGVLLCSTALHARITKIVIERTELLMKSGGRSGDYSKT